MSSMISLLRLRPIPLLMCILLLLVNFNMVGRAYSIRVTGANDTIGMHDDELTEIQKSVIHQQLPESTHPHFNRDSNKEDPKIFKQDSSNESKARKETQGSQEVSWKDFQRKLAGSDSAELDHDEDVLLQKMAMLKETVDAVRPQSTVGSGLQNHAESKERSKSLTAEREGSYREETGKLGTGTEKQSKDEKTRKAQQDQNLEDAREKSSMRESKRAPRDVPMQQVEAGKISQEKVIEVGGDRSNHIRSESQSQKDRDLELKSQEKADGSERKSDPNGQDPRKNDEQLKQSGTARDLVTPPTVRADQQFKQGQEQERIDLDSSRTSFQEDGHALGAHGSVPERKQGQAQPLTAMNETLNPELQTGDNQPVLHGVPKDRISSETPHKEKRSDTELDGRRQSAREQRVEENAEFHQQKSEQEAKEVDFIADLHGVPKDRISSETPHKGKRSDTELDGRRQSAREQRVEENAEFHQQKSEQEAKEVDFIAEEQQHQDKEQQQTTSGAATERKSVPRQVQEGSENTGTEHAVEHEQQPQEQTDAAANGDKKSAIPEEEEPFVFPEPYLLGPPIKDWDEQRAKWLEANSQRKTTSKGKPRVLIVTGSQPYTCRSPIGDFFHIRSLKIKIDYARMHDYELYYNFVWLDPLFVNYWVKLPTVRKLMLTHPEIEWIFWVDSDAIFTDMLFEAPFDQYDREGANMVMWGWAQGFFVEKRWVAFNAGVFILRNCQWSLDLIDKWSPMGPSGRVQEEYGKILTEYLTARDENYPADDQSALAYLILTDEEVKAKVKLVDQFEYQISGWWVEIVNTYEDIAEKYHPGLGDTRWPWITHFTGCSPCNRNPATDDYGECMKHVDRALNFADNQVLAYIGYQHESLSSQNVTQIRSETQRPIDFVDHNPWEERMAKVAAAAS